MQNAKIEDQQRGDEAAEQQPRPQRCAEIVEVKESNGFQGILQK